MGASSATASVGLGEGPSRTAGWTTAPVTRRLRGIRRRCRTGPGDNRRAIGVGEKR